MANALLLPTTYQGPQLDIAGNLLKGQQLRAQMNENALAPQRQQNLEQQNQINALNISRAGTVDQAEKIKMQMEGQKLLAGPSKYIVSVYEKDPELAKRLYQSLIPVAQQYGIPATPEYDNEQMKMFVAGAEGGQKQGQELPYRVGSRQKFNKNGKEFEGTFQGLDSNKSPVWGDVSSTGGERGKEVFTQEDKLRNEFLNVTKPFREVRDAYGRIKEAAKNPSAAGDLALIFNYMKMLDPGSVVREGEFATAQNAAGVPDRIKAMYNKAISGERLADSTRADFVDRSEMLYKTADNQHKQASKEYKRIAKDAGLKESIFPDLSVAGVEVVPKAPGAGKAMDSLPPASQHKGRTIIDTSTGKRLKSDGNKWIEASAATGDNPQMASAADTVKGWLSKAAGGSKSIVQLRNELVRAEAEGDDQKANEIRKQINEISKQTQNVG